MRSPVASLGPHEVMLVSDFDGTLADIGPDPDATVPRPDAMHAVRRLAARLALFAVVSSRPHDRLESLVRVAGVQLIGDSGLGQPAPATAAELAAFNRSVAPLVEPLRGIWVEAKPASTSLHFRRGNLGAATMLELIEPLLRGGGLEALVGRKVIEIHGAGLGKRQAVAGLLASTPHQGVVCLGDDENDRSVFELVSGLEEPTFVVGVASDEAPADLFQSCDLVVPSPTDAAALLGQIAQWAEGPLVA